MIDPSLAARLRDVLSPNTFLAAGERARQAYVSERQSESSVEASEHAYRNAYRDVLIDALLPLLLSLQEEQRREAKDVVEDLVYQFGVKNNNGTVWTGGLSALEGAFDFLGWNDDPHPVDAGMLCDEPGCKAWISCGTPTSTGYRSTCGKHAPRLASSSSASARREQE